MTKIYYSTLTNKIDRSIWSSLCAKTVSQKRELVSRFQFDVDKKLSLYSNLLVRIIVNKELSVSNSQLTFCTNEYGKPHIARYRDFNFNISHTRSAIVIAIHTNEIGVDIERVLKPELTIAHRFFTQQELCYIRETGNPERFYEIWTKKEAYIKWRGKGFAIPLLSFNVLELSDLFYYRILGDYALSVCGNLSSNIQLHRITEQSLVGAALELEDIEV